MIDLAQITSLLSGLVKIESINPDLVPGGSGEGAIARYVAGYLEKSGLEARVQDVAPGRVMEHMVEGRANAVGILRGRGSGKCLMLNGHLDTVGVAGMEEPFSARVEGGRLYGRGAQDMKGGLAAGLAVAAALAKEARLKGDLIVAAVADEEHESLGTRALLEKFRADAAIVLEPTNLEITTAHKGFVWAKVETHGRAAHGSSPQEGRDAIAFMGRVLVEIEKLQDQLNRRPNHALLGSGSLHASLISGGQELSSYPASCQLTVERRLLPGEDAATFGQELEEIISRLSAQDPRFRATFTLGYSALALETPADAPIARTLMESARKVIGSSARFGAQGFWTDAALLSQSGIPSVLFGPGGAGLHSAVEYVRLEDVRLCAETLVECARRYCGV